MQHTIEFNSSFANNWQFNAQGAPVSPGARELADVIVDRLKAKGVTTKPVNLHSYYGWAFVSELDGITFFHVLNPVDVTCFLTISLDRYWLKWLMLKQPKKTLLSYCDLLRQVLSEIPQISSIKMAEVKSR